MKIVEIGPGTDPIEWHGEAADYVGIDHCYRNQQQLDSASKKLLNNEDINRFGLVPCRAEYVESKIPPDVVFMRDVLAKNTEDSYNIKLIKHALRIAFGAPVYVIEKKPPKSGMSVYRNNLAKIEGIGSRILTPSQVGFSAIWNQVSKSREFTKTARVLYFPPQLNIAQAP